MPNHHPQLATFACHPSDIPTQITAGSQHLILEDPRVSIRTFQKMPLDDTPLLELIQTAKKHTSSLSFNLDIIAHHADFELIEHIIRLLRDQKIHHIRIQDYGLAPLIRDINPKAEISLFTETSSTNYDAIKTLSTLFEAQQLSNEIPFSELIIITSKIQKKFDLLVQGPLLIQYSPRRFMQNQPTPITDDPIIAKAVDDQYPNRTFTFLDNPHGHFMYLYFHRCLVRYYNELCQLNLRYWIIDTRGLDANTTQHYIQTYTQHPIQNPNEELQNLAKISGISQRPGFFRANKTDQERTSISRQEASHCIGTIIDIIKHQSLTIQTTSSLQVGEELKIITPEGRHLPITLTGLVDPLTNTPLQTSLPHQLIQIPYTKGAAIQSMVIRNKPTES